MKVSIYEPLFLPGNFSGVRAEFTFERSCSYFLIEMYGMSVVLVAISWMGFLVPLDQTAARIALGITSVLTEVAILNIMNNAMPKVCDHLKESNTINFFHCLHTDMVSGNDVIQYSKQRASAEWSVSLEIFSTVDFFRKIVLAERTASFPVSLLSYTNLDQ